MSSLVPITLQIKQAASDSTVPLYLIHDGSGTLVKYLTLRVLDCDVFGISDPNFRSGATWVGGISEMARTYARMIEKNSPNKSIALGGWCSGGNVAVQTAYELRSSPFVHVQGIILIDTSASSDGRDPEDAKFWPGLVDKHPAMRKAVVSSIKNGIRMMNDFVPPRWDDDITPPPTVLIRAKEKVSERDDAHESPSTKKALLGWEDYSSVSIIKTFDVDGNHFTMFDQRNIHCLSTSLSKAVYLLQDFVPQAGMREHQGDEMWDKSHKLQP